MRPPRALSRLPLRQRPPQVDPQARWLPFVLQRVALETAVRVVLRLQLPFVLLAVRSLLKSPGVHSRIAALLHPRVAIQVLTCHALPRSPRRDPAIAPPYVRKTYLPPGLPHHGQPRECSLLVR